MRRSIPQRDDAVSSGGGRRQVRQDELLYWHSALVLVHVDRRDRQPDRVAIVGDPIGNLLVVTGVRDFLTLVQLLGEVGALNRIDDRAGDQAAPVHARIVRRELALPLWLQEV